jgi:hypothetical protein
MSDEITELEESITEVLLELMTERTMSERRMSTKVQESSMGGVQPPHQLIEQEHLESK